MKKVTTRAHKAFRVKPDFFQPFFCDQDRCHIEHTCARTLQWVGSAAAAVCSPISKLTHANLRRQGDRVQGEWRRRKETNKRMAGGKKTRKGRGGGALRWGIRVRRLEVEDDIMW